MSKPFVFIGSSVEGLEVARAIKAELEHLCECQIWHQGLFGLTDGTLETLVNSLPKFDFAILALTKDDLLRSREEERNAPRDNVLFELGLFIGGLGQKRTFIVADRSARLKLPSDLAGITLATFEQPQKGSMQSAVGTACYEILRVISATELKEGTFSNTLMQDKLQTANNDKVPIALPDIELDKLDADGTLQELCTTEGKPQVQLLQDDDLGNLIKFTGNYERDALNWTIKSSAQKARELEIIFKNTGTFYFYVSVLMMNQSGSKTTTRWVRFDQDIAKPLYYNTDEMRMPYDSMPFKGFNKATINIEEAVKQTYGKSGWSYNKIITFRIKCKDATIKSVSFRR